MPSSRLCSIYKIRHRDSLWGWGSWSEDGRGPPKHMRAFCLPWPLPEVTQNPHPSWNKGLKKYLSSKAPAKPHSCPMRTSTDKAFSRSSSLSSWEETRPARTLDVSLYQVSEPGIRTEHPRHEPASAFIAEGHEDLFSGPLSNVYLWGRKLNSEDRWNKRNRSLRPGEWFS